MKNIFIPVLFSLLFISCGSNSSSKLNQDKTTASNDFDTTQEEEISINNDSKEQSNTEFMPTNTTLQECIEQNKKDTNTTDESLKKLSCSNLTTKNFELLGSLMELESISIHDTILDANDISLIFSNVNKRELKYISLENNSLTKSSVDRMGTYASFPNVTYLSLKGNEIEGLAVIDYFVNLETLNLEGSTYPQSRLHHASGQNNLKVFYMGSNPNVRHLNDFISSDRLKIKNTLEILDITNMPNLTDITALSQFSVLKKVIIDSRENRLFGDTLREYNLEIDLK